MMTRMEIKKEIRSLRRLLNAERPDPRDRKYRQGVNLAKAINAWVKDKEAVQLVADAVAPVLVAAASVTGGATMILAAGVSVMVAVAPHISEWWERHQDAKYEADLALWEKKEALSEVEVLMKKQRLVYLEEMLDAFDQPSGAPKRSTFRWWHVLVPTLLLDDLRARR